MKFGTLLSWSWGLYRTHFGLIAAITIMVWLPCDLIQTYLESEVFGENAIWSPLFSSQFLSVFIGILSQAGILCVLEQDAAGKVPSIRGCLSQGLEHWPRLVIAQFLFTLGFLIGFALLIAPGVVFGVRCSVLGPMVIRERITGMRAIGRSFALTQEYFWKLLGWGLMITVYTVPVMFLIHIPTFFSSLDWWLPHALESTLSNVVVSFFTVFMWVVYDELLKQEALDTPAPTASPSQP